MPIAGMADRQQLSFHRKARTSCFKAFYTVGEQANAFIGIIHGAGKTTLLKILLGIEPPDTGAVCFDGEQIAFCLQDEPDVTLSMRAFADEMAGAGRIDSARFECLVDAFGIADCMNQRPSECSEGQRKKFYLSLAFACPSELLLLDEPTNHLDPDSVAFLLQLIQDWKGALLMVSHDSRMDCPIHWVMEGGQLNENWNTASLFSLPLSVVCYMASTLFLLRRQGMPLAVVLLVIAIPSLPVLKAHMAGGKKALHERKQSEYNERRKTEEMSLCASKAFLLAYHMENHTAKMLGGLFQQYMRQDGEKKVRFQAGLDALDFLLQHAIPLCILMIGISLTKAGNLPIGAIVTGYSYDAKRLIFNTFRIGFIKCITLIVASYKIADWTTGYKII